MRYVCSSTLVRLGADSMLTPHFYSLIILLALENTETFGSRRKMEMLTRRLLVASGTAHVLRLRGCFASW